jgi:hypothetical protein
LVLPWLVALLAVALVTLAGCAPLAGATPQAGATSPVRPTTPPTWTTTASPADDLWAALPPWLIVFESSGAIFANEVAAPGAQGLQLMVEGPQTTQPQPSFGEGLRSWLELGIGAPGQGSPTVRSIDLPLGRAVTIERLDRPGTPGEWRIYGAAIQTPFGAAYLLVDGPPSAWTGAGGRCGPDPLAAGRRERTLAMTRAAAGRCGFAGATRRDGCPCIVQAA